MSHCVTRGAPWVETHICPPDPRDEELAKLRTKLAEAEAETERVRNVGAQIAVDRAFEKSELRARAESAEQRVEDWKFRAETEAKLRESAEQERDQARKELSWLEGVINQLDTVGRARAEREGKPYDRYTCWAEPAAHLLEDLAASQARERETRAKAIEEAIAAVEIEPEYPGEPSPSLLDEMKTAPIVAVRATVRLTKTAIISRLRALATTGSPGEEKTREHALAWMRNGPDFPDGLVATTGTPAQPAKEAERCGTCRGSGRCAEGDCGRHPCPTCNGTGTAKKERA